MSPSTNARITIRGRETHFTSRTLKSGETAYYRDGKRVRTQYQKRLAKGVLAGKDPRASVGKRNRDFNEHFRAKSLRESDLETLRREAGAKPSDGSPASFSLANWGATFGSHEKGARYRYYADVSVTNESLRAVGSPEGDEEACKLITLGLVKNEDGRIVKEFTRAEIQRDFRSIILYSVKKRGLELCSGDPKRDVVRFWRHADH